ncbi:tetratricopeptide repeat protein [Natronospora cellulosivora (SeqCode)]
MKYVIIILLFLLFIFYINNFVSASDLDIDKERQEIRSLIQEKRFEDMMSRLDYVLTYEDVNIISDIYNTAIIELQRQAEYEVELELINQILSKNLNHYRIPSFYRRRTKILFDLYRYEEALKYSEEYLEILEESVFRSNLFIERLGRLYFRTQDYDRAIKHLEWALENTTISKVYEYAPAAFNLMDLYFALGKEELALELIEEGLQEYEDITRYYLQYHAKLVRYHFIKKDWDKFRQTNKLPLPFFQRIVARNSEAASTIEKLNYMYRYRDNEDFINMYINYFLWKHNDVLNSNLEIDSLNSRGMLAYYTMKGVAHFWNDEKDKALKFLVKANNRNNFLLDEASLYAALIEIERGNFEEADRHMKGFRSLSRSDISEEGNLILKFIGANLGTYEYKILW